MMAGLAGARGSRVWAGRHCWRRRRLERLAGRCSCGTRGGNDCLGVWLFCVGMGAAGLCSPGGWQLAMTTGQGQSMVCSSSSSSSGEDLRAKAGQPARGAGISET